MRHAAALAGIEEIVAGDADPMLAGWIDAAAPEASAQWLARSKTRPPRSPNGSDAGTPGEAFLGGTVRAGTLLAEQGVATTRSATIGASGTSKPWKGSGPVEREASRVAK